MRHFLKRMQTTTLAEALATFLEGNADCKLSMSKFCDMRPPQVQLLKDYHALASVTNLLSCYFAHYPELVSTYPQDILSS